MRVEKVDQNLRLFHSLSGYSRLFWLFWKLGHTNARIYIDEMRYRSFLRKLASFLKNLALNRLRYIVFRSLIKLKWFILILLLKLKRFIWRFFQKIAFRYIFFCIFLITKHLKKLFLTFYPMWHGWRCKNLMLNIWRLAV